MRKKVEILAPAKNLLQGMLAINSGADAVYIGAPNYGARSNATNPIEDIAELVRYAHLFKAQVFVVINTILYDNELDDCQKLIHELYNIGVDALIVQDMAIFEMDLPPIVLHASTQANNRDPKQVKFLHEAGMERIVLARELNLDQIKEIHEASDVELEFFVSGALCVSFSGNCYMSIAGGERSANRGSCAQNCRLPYELIDGTGTTLISSSHLLSIKDLDSFLANNNQYQKASSGRTIINFDPQMDRSFNRGYTDYFVNHRTKKIGSWESPKSQGQYIGKVTNFTEKGYFIENADQLNNGDGLYFINENGEADGLQINVVLNDLVIPNTYKSIPVGTDIYRNSDAAFNRLVEREDATIRKIGVTMTLNETSNGFELIVIDEDGHKSVASFSVEKEVSNKGEQVLEDIKKNLSKTGNTPFIVDEIVLNLTDNWFLVSSIGETYCKNRSSFSSSTIGFHL